MSSQSAIHSSPHKNSSKLILQTLQGLPQSYPPFWFMRQAGRYLPEYLKIRSQVSEFLEICLTPSLASTLTLQPIQRFNPDAAILFSDILILPYALGYQVTFVGGEGPRLSSPHTNPFQYSFSKTLFYDRTAPVYETVAEVAARLPNSVTLIGFAGAPWTIACYMIEGKNTQQNWTKIKKLALSCPKSFESFLNHLADITITYLIGQIDAGAEVVQLFDSWAGAVPATVFYRFIIAPTQRIVKTLKSERPHIPIIGFTKGTGLFCKDYAEQTGIDSISLDSYTTTSWAARTLSPEIVVQGNLDPIYLLIGGTPMITETQKIITDLAGYPHIFNLGHGILPETPPNHVEILAHWLREEAPKIIAQNI